jgi:hypothetical protein
MFGIIRTIRNSWRHSRAVVTASNLLDHAGLAGDSTRIAEAAVTHAWQAYAPRLDGRFGIRPRHEVLALFALALAVKRGIMGEKARPAVREALVAGLGKRGLYTVRSREWQAAGEIELVAFARAVLDDPANAVLEPPSLGEEGTASD